MRGAGYNRACADPRQFISVKPARMDYRRFLHSYRKRGGDPSVQTFAAQGGKNNGLRYQHIFRFDRFVRSLLQSILEQSYVSRKRGFLLAFIRRNRQRSYGKGRSGFCGKVSSKMSSRLNKRTSRRTAPEI